MCFNSALYADGFKEVYSILKKRNMSPLANGYFYSEDSVGLFSTNGNSFIMPVPFSRVTLNEAVFEAWSSDSRRLPV